MAQTEQQKQRQPTPAETWDQSQDRARRSGDPQAELDREDPKPEIQRTDLEQPQRRGGDVDPDSAESDVDRDD